MFECIHCDILSIGMRASAKFSHINSYLRKDSSDSILKVATKIYVSQLINLLMK